MTNCLLYARHSPKPGKAEADPLDTIERQVADCIAHARDMGWNLIGEPFIDRGVSGVSEEGSDLSEAPSLLRAINALCRGDVLLCVKRDRLGRGSDRMRTVRGMVRARKGLIVSVADDLGSDETPDERMIRAIKEAVDQREVETTRQRTSDAMRKRQASGIRINPKSQVPWGMRAVGKQGLEPCPHETSVRARILALRAEGLSYPDIAERLWREGIRPRKDRRSRRYSASAVRRIVGKSSSRADEPPMNPPSKGTP